MNLELMLFSVVSGFFVSASPCQLPVYPVLLNIISTEQKERRYHVLSFAFGHGLMYSLLYVGFAFVIRLMGASKFENLTSLVYTIAYLLGGVICILFAVQTIGHMRIYNRSFGLRKKSKPGVFGAFTAGVLLATVVSPCNLPYLIAVYLPLLSATTTFLDGLIAIFLFTSTITLPLLVMGILSDYAIDKWIKHHIRHIETLSAVFLAAIGWYFLNIAASTF